MMNKVGLNERQKWFVYISLFYILYQCFPLFSYYVPVTPQAVAILVSVSFAILYPKALWTTPMCWAYVFFLVLLIYSLLGKYIHVNGVDNSTLSAYIRILVEAAWIIPSVLMGSIICISNSRRLIKSISKGTIIIILLSFLYILPLMYLYSDILRDMELVEEMGLPLGMPDYTLMHAYIFLLPGLCLGIKISNGLHRYIYMASVALVYYIIIHTYVTTTINIATVFIIWVLIESRKSRISLVVLIVVIFISLFLYYSDFFLLLINWLLPYFEGTAVEPKLMDFQSSLIAGKMTGGTIIARENLHSISRDSFLYNPIIGGEKVGGHSHVLDILGSMGIVGFIPFFMIIWSTMKLYVAMMNTGFDRRYLYYCFGIAGTLLYLKGIFGSTGWLFMCVIAPSLVIYVSEFFHRSTLSRDVKNSVFR